MKKNLVSRKEITKEDIDMEKLGKKVWWML